MNVFINLRDELIVIDTNEVAYVKAYSNYSDVVFIKGGKRTLTMTLSKVEELFKVASMNNDDIHFVRIGKSLLINQRYLIHINILGQKLHLGDYDGHSYFLPVSKGLLKKYKKTFSEVKGNSSLT